MPRTRCHPGRGIGFRALAPVRPPAQAAGTLSPDDLAELSGYLKADYDPDQDFLPPDLSQSVGQPVRVDY